MACKDCKKKKNSQPIDDVPTKSFFNMDRWVGWIIGIWFLLGLYGLVSVIKDLLQLL